MKKLTIAGLILAAGLVLLGAGCAGPKPAEQINTNANTNAAVNENVNANVNVNVVQPGVTSEELNQLKSDINSMNYEDLNALSNQ